MKNKKIPIFPVLLTTGNLFCGFMSLMFAVSDALKLVRYEDVLRPFVLSCLLVLVAMLFDMLDGIVARITKTESSFGIEYDSLADIISFGLAPAVIMYLSVLRYLGRLGLVFAALYVIFGTMRLARFNVDAHAGRRDPKYFTGLPIPAAASVLVSYVLFSQWADWYYVSAHKLFYDKAMGWYAENIYFFQHVAIPVIMLILAVLMISNVKFISLKYYLTREKIGLVFLAAAVAVLLVLIVKPEATAFALTSLYVLSGVVGTGLNMFSNKSKIKKLKLDEK